jgi:thiamine pyrophosphokinase
VEAAGNAETRTAVIVAGGDPIDPGVVWRLPDVRFVIAADSGLDEIHRLGLTADLIVGDLDSASAPAIARATELDIPIRRYPADKDATDLELALRFVGGAGYTDAVLIGGSGGRLSHLLGNALVITSTDYAELRITWHVGPTTVLVVRESHPRTIDGAVGDLVSLIPTGGAATGVTTTGLRWHLDDAVLAAGATHGISNKMTEPAAQVAITGGVLLAVHERASNERNNQP